MGIQTLRELKHKKTGKTIKITKKTPGKRAYT